MKYILLFTASFLLHLSASSQYTCYNDAIQSQVYDNPAAIGSNGSVQVRASYNNTGYNHLGSNSYRQGNMYYDNGMELKNKDIIAFGFGANMDRSVHSDFGHTAINSASAYHKRLGTSSRFLTFGTSFSATRKTYDSNRLSTLQTSTGLGSTSTTVINAGNYNSTFWQDRDASTYYLSLDLGLMYSIYGNDNQYLKMGIAIQDVNEPDVSLNDNSETPQSNTVVISVLGQVNVFGRFHVEPSFRHFFQKQNGTTAVANNFKYQLSETRSILLGVGYLKSRPLHTRPDMFFLNAGADIRNCRAMLVYSWAHNTPLSTKVVELNLSYQIR